MESQFESRDLFAANMAVLVSKHYIRSNVVNVI